MDQDDIKKAIASREIELWFQPIVSLEDLAVVGFEGLVRWRHPSKGVLGPAAFIEHALSKPLRDSFNQLVLEQAIQFAQKTADWPQLKVSVNFAGDVFNDCRLPSQIQQLLDVYGVMAKKLAIEVTEVDAISYKQAEPVFNQLSEMGLSISVDDFGTGFASLTHVRHIPLSSLKIDRSFVLAMEESPEDSIIVENACNLGTSLHLDVIAEGVERPDQIEMLRGFNCTHAQGFYFSAAVPCDEAIEMLHHPATQSKTNVSRPGESPAIRLDTALTSMEDIVACPECQQQLGLNTLDFVPMIVCIKTASGRFAWSNRYHAEATLSNNSLPKPSARDVHPIEEANTFRADDLRVIATGKAVIGRHEPCTHADGRRVELTTTKFPIQNISGQNVGILCFCNEQDTQPILSKLYATDQFCQPPTDSHLAVSNG